MCRHTDGRLDLRQLCCYQPETDIHMRRRVEGRAEKWGGTSADTESLATGPYCLSHFVLFGLFHFQKGTCKCMKEYINQIDIVASCMLIGSSAVFLFLFLFLTMLLG